MWTPKPTMHHPVGRERITATPGVSRVQYMSKEDVLNQYRGYMADYAVLLDEFENDNPSRPTTVSLWQT